MKKLIIIFALSLFAATPVAAITAKTCALVSQSARGIMEARQNSDVSMIKAVEIMNGNTLGIMLVKSAYRTPKYATESYKQNAINEFANRYASECYKLIK